MIFNIVEIQDTYTGEVQLYLDEVDFDLWWWTEGNGGCDCNRDLFFRTAKGEEDHDTRFCLGEGQYAIRITNTTNGREWYVDEMFDGKHTTRR